MVHFSAPLKRLRRLAMREKLRLTGGANKSTRMRESLCGGIKRWMIYDGMPRWQQPFELFYRWSRLFARA
eukprot:12039710-Prorocentrum_lima.AAC.1